jgi:hypothetical protein
MPCLIGLRRIRATLQPSAALCSPLQPFPSSIHLSLHRLAPLDYYCVRSGSLVYTRGCGGGLRESTRLFSLSVSLVLVIRPYVCSDIQQGPVGRSSFVSPSAGQWKSSLQPR